MRYMCGVKRLNCFPPHFYVWANVKYFSSSFDIERITVFFLSTSSIRQMNTFPWVCLLYKISIRVVFGVRTTLL